MPHWNSPRALMPSMRSRLAFKAVFAVLSAAFLAFAPNISAQSVATKPVGAVTLTIPQGTTALSLQLEDQPVFIGTVNGATANSIAVASVSWASNQYANAALPHAVRIGSGQLAGSTFLVISHTDAVLTVDTKSLNLSGLISSGDSISIIPIDTLGTLFGTGSVDFQTGSSASSADNLMLWDGSSWLTYFHNGTNWRRAGSLSNQNNTPLLPNEGFMILRRSVSALSFTIVGSPRVAASRDLLRPASSTFLATGFPVDRQISSLGFKNMAAWQTGSSASSADNVIIWSGSSWLTFFHNGTSWRRSGSLSNQDTFVVPAGAPLFVKRISSSSLVNSLVVNQPPYTL